MPAREGTGIRVRLVTAAGIERVSNGLLFEDPCTRWGRDWRRVG
jgi:hypothetical protein